MISYLVGKCYGLIDIDGKFDNEYIQTPIEVKCRREWILNS